MLLWKPGLTLKISSFVKLNYKGKGGGGKTKSI